MNLPAFSGKRGVDIPRESAYDHVFGFTIFNDVSARDFQMREQAGQLGPAKGKDFDTGNVLGPWIVTLDEIGDPHNLTMVARVNGEEWSRGNSGGMYHRFDAIIAHLSMDQTIHPGEVIGSGTAATGSGLEHGQVPSPGIHRRVGNRKNRNAQKSIRGVKEGQHDPGQCRRCTHPFLAAFQGLVDTALDPHMTILLKDHLPDDLWPWSAAAGVDKIVVVEAAETVEETDFVLGLAQKYPLIAGVVGWIDLASPDVAAVLRSLKSNPLYKGVRPCHDDNKTIQWMKDPANDVGFRALVDLNLSFDALVQEFSELPCIISVAERFPDLSIILDHLGKPNIANNIFPSWAADIDRLAKHLNVVCKFSGILNQAKAGWTLKGIRPYTDHVVNCFRAERLLCGQRLAARPLDRRVQCRMASGARLTGTPSGSRTRNDFRGERDSHLSALREERCQVFFFWDLP